MLSSSHLVSIPVFHHMVISVDPAFYVINECTAISAAMRKNARWAQSGVAAILGYSVADADGDEGLAAKLGLRPRNQQLGTNNPLISGFARLRSDLSDDAELAHHDTIHVLGPFLEVIRSQATNGLITALALSSVSKFFAYGLITKDSPNIRSALRLLVDSVTHCRFEATDQAEDDGVLLKILSLLSDLVSGPLGGLLSDNSICEIIETCLSMACQMRRGDILRRSAEMTMTKLCQSVFYRLQDMPLNEAITNSEEGDVSVSMHQNGETYQGNSISVASDPVKSDLKAEKSSKNDDTTKQNEIEKDETSSLAPEDQDIEEEPYGLASIREVLRVLTSIVDPASYHQYTDSTRVLSLRLLTVAFEVGGCEIAKRPSLLLLITSRLTKHLYQLVRLDNPLLLQASLRVILTLIHTNSEHLKLHIEFLLTYILSCLSQLPDIPRDQDMDDIFFDGVPNRPKLARPASTIPYMGGTPKTGSTASFQAEKDNINGRATPTNNVVTNIKSPEIREIMIEFLVNVTRSSRDSSFFTDLFVNYDCDVDRRDVCEDLIGFLCRNAYPDSASWSTSSVPPLCLDAVLAFISGLNSRAKHDLTDEDEKKVRKIVDRRSLKKLSIAAVDAFNNDAKKGIKLLIETKLISDDSPEHIAHFLKSSGRLNKTVLGEFLTKGSNKDIMDKFVESFDFSNIRIDEALRDFLSFFRLPGESALIERIFEKFSEQYCNGTNNTEFVDNEDSAFVLSYAVILLNTDLYNPQIKRHMTMEDFARNLRGANNNKDFAPEYLEEIFKAIKSREIVLPDEHDTDETFEYAWRNMLIKQSQAGMLNIRSSPAFDKYVFETCWKPVVTILSYIFATATDDMVFARVITGFNMTANLASIYGTPNVIDHIVTCLAWISTLTGGDFTTPTTNREIEMVSADSTSKSFVVSDLSVSFGSDFKAQMAAVTLFTIANTCIKDIKKAWIHLIRALGNLYLSDMISIEELQTKALPKISRVKPARKFKRSSEGKETGLFSTLSSYLTSYNDGIVEPTEEEIEATNCALECVNACDAGQLLSKVLLLDDLAEKEIIVEAILSCVSNIVEIANGPQDTHYTAMKFFLHCAVDLSTNNEQATIMTGNMIRDEILGNSKTWHDSFINYSVALYLSLQKTYPKSLELDPILNIDPNILRRAPNAIMKPLITGKSITDPKQWKIIEICAIRNPESVYQFIQDKADAPASIWNVICNSTSTPIKDNDHVDIALNALNSLFRMEEIQAKKPNKNWFELSKAIGNQTINVNGKIRSQALNYLEQLLLSRGLEERYEFDWKLIFDELILPNINDLLKPEVFELDPHGMGTTRNQVASLLCKVFLQYIVHEQQHQNKDLSIDLWTKVLDMLDRLMNSSQKDSLRESVVESLKNALLVVKSSNLGSEKFWEETWKRIGKFLPTLRQEIDETSLEEKDLTIEPDKPGDELKDKSKDNSKNQSENEPEEGSKDKSKDQPKDQSKDQSKNSSTSQSTDEPTDEQVDLSID